MKKTLLTIVLLFIVQNNFAQLSQEASVLNIILKKYYKNEKPVYKNRRQLLYFYCDKINNNEELLEICKKPSITKEFSLEIKSSLKKDLGSKNWNTALEEIYANENPIIKQKINGCQNIDNFQALSKLQGLNNQRLMIVSKPIFYSKSAICIVKISFYRNIEHNNGVVLLLEKVNNIWTIKEELNAWET